MEPVATDPAHEGPASGAQVRLTIPATVEYLRLARLNVAGVAAEAGFTVEEIEDLKIAADELCTLLVDSGEGGAIELTLHPAPGVLTVSGERATPAGAGGNVEEAPAPLAADELVDAIVDAMVDAHEIGTDPGRRWFRFTKQAREH